VTQRSFLIENGVGHRSGQPSQIQRAVIAAHQPRADRDPRAEQPHALDPLEVILGFGAKRQDHVLAVFAAGEPVVSAVRCHRVWSQQRSRDAQHEPACPPVGEVQERVEVIPHPPARIPLEVAVIIDVDEPAGRDRRARRVRAQRVHLILGERPIHRLKLVI
jgi:hypothetical protein